MLHSLDITEGKEDKLYNLYRVKISQEGLTKTLKGASVRVAHSEGRHTVRCIV